MKPTYIRALLCYVATNILWSEIGRDDGEQRVVVDSRVGVPGLEFRAFAPSPSSPTQYH